MSVSGVDGVKKNISNLYEIRRVKLYALSLSYAQRATKRARANKKWTDRTGDAVKRMFSRRIDDGDDLGFFLSHGVEYGIYLELANDRKYEIIRPIIADLADKFYDDAQKII